MTAANVVLVLATSLSMVVISGREKANAIVFLLSVVFYSQQLQNSKRSSYLLYSGRFLSPNCGLQRRHLYSNTKLNVRANFHLALVNIYSLDLWFSWVIKILSSSPQFVHHFQFFFTRMTSLSEKSFRFILKFVLDYPRLSANSHRRARIYNKGTRNIQIGQSVSFGIIIILIIIIIMLYL